MALPFNDVLLEDDEFPKEEEDELPAVPPQWQPLEGFATREALIARMFNEWYSYVLKTYVRTYVRLTVVIGETLL